MESLDNKSMLQQLQSGDQKVLGKLYRQYRSEFLAWMTAKYACSRDEARDIYQNTMLTLSQKAQNGGLETLNSSLKTYIYGIGKNKYKEYRRQYDRHSPLEKQAEDLIPAAEPDVVDEEMVRLARQCLEQLGEPCKSLLELYYFHGLSMDEIKKHLIYRNAHTARNMKYKCMQRLKQIFKTALAQQSGNAENAHEQL